MKNPVVHLMAALGVAERITRHKSGEYGGEVSDLQGIVDAILSVSHNRATARDRR